MAQLEECLFRSKLGLIEYEAYLQADLDLHEIIVAAARNPLLHCTTFLPDSYQH
ncbi:MAG: hypothetical protein PVS3B3_09830 [Ktedonobacteraceae bacterium]